MSTQLDDKTRRRIAEMADEANEWYEGAMLARTPRALLTTLATELQAEHEKEKATLKAERDGSMADTIIEQEREISALNIANQELGILLAAKDAEIARLRDELKHYRPERWEAPE